MPSKINFTTTNPVSLSVAQTEAPGSFCSLIDPSSILTENLCKATLDRESDGYLRFKTPNRFGCLEYSFFVDEKHLDNYLGNASEIDIWEIEDNRTYQPTTVYKYENGFGEMLTLTKEELFREMASGSEHGVFCIQDLKAQEKSYFQKKQGWLQHGFEEVCEAEAKKIQEQREASFQTRRKLFAITVSALAATPAALGLGKMLSKSWQNLSELNNSLTFSSIEKIIPLASSAILLSHSSLPNRHLTFPVLLGTLSALSSIKAQSCVQWVGSYDTPGFAQGVAISDNYAYVADSLSLQIIDVTNKAAPVLAGNTPSGAQEIVISGNYAYAAAAGSGLQIFDVTNKTAPVLAGSHNTSIGYAHGIAISGNYAYVAAWNTCLQIFDVTNKAAPVLAGSCNTPDSTNGVAISGNYAYVTDHYSSLHIIDVTNKTAPVLAGSFNTTDSTYGVAISGNYAYVAGWTSLQIIDVTNKTAPKLIRSYDLLDEAINVAISGNYAYIADELLGFRIINVTNKTAPELAGSYDTSPGTARGVAISGNYAYVANGDTGLQIIDLFCQLPTTSSSAVSSISSSILSSVSSAPHSTEVLSKVVF
jgi:hypothetical protein